MGLFLTITSVTAEALKTQNHHPKKTDHNCTLRRHSEAYLERVMVIPIKTYYIVWDRLIAGPVTSRNDMKHQIVQILVYLT